MIRVVWAREPIPAGPSVFLAGPTPRAGDGVESWRPAAIDAIRRAWQGSPLTVLTPESRGGVRAKHYDDQFEWETTARAAATVVLFWIPRDLEHLPGMTTNVEFGHDVAVHRQVVLGCPARLPQSGTQPVPDRPRPPLRPARVRDAGRHRAHSAISDRLTRISRGLESTQDSGPHSCERAFPRGRAYDASTCPHHRHQEADMLIVRDRSRNGRAVSWGTDHERMREIAATNPHFELWNDTAASRYYWNVEREDMAWVHPYDLDAQLYAEIKP